MEREKNVKKYRRYSKIFFVVASFLIVSSLVSYFGSQYLIKYQIHKNVLLANDSKAIQFWLYPNNVSSVKRKYYFFNVENPDQVQAGIAKPNLTQKGPYCFNEILEKKNYKFLDKDLLQFDPVSTIYFDSECSNGNKMSDIITYLYIPAVGMNEALLNKKTKNFTYEIINGITLLNSLFEKRSVSDLLSGFFDPLNAVAFALGLTKNFKFSLLNGKNGTIWQNYSMNTGFTDYSKIGNIKTWDNETTLNFFNDSFANQINGTDGTIFAPFRTRDQTLYAFSPDMCRSYSLNYLRDSSVKGVKTYAYHLTDDIFYNSTVSPHNPTFCGITDKCLGNGVHNISKCYGGVSAFMSLPHFLNAEEKFISDLEGLKPDKDLHDFVFNFEPTSGVMLAGSVRFQINFYVYNNPELRIFKHVKPVLIPVIWFEEEIQLSDSIASQLKTVALISYLCIIIPLVMLCFGFFWSILAVSLRIYVSYMSNENDYEQIPDKDSKSTDENEPQQSTSDEKSILIN